MSAAPRLLRARSKAHALVTASLLLTAMGCGSPGPSDSDGALVVALESAPTNLDPRLGSDQASERLFDLFLEGLVRRDAQGRLHGDLATSWEVLDGGRRYRFHLDGEASFHDGRPVGAADVAWTFGSILDGTVPTAKRGSLGPLERVAVVDAATVDFVLSEPWGSLLSNLTAGLGIVPAGTTPEAMNRAPVGSGPFRVVARRPDVVELAAFDGHRRGRPPLDRLVLETIPDATVRALELEKGTAHLVVNGLPPDAVVLFRGRPGFRVDESPGANSAYRGLNLEDPVLDDRRVRRAIAMAIDRQLLVDTLWRGLGDVTETLVPPGHWARHDGLEPIPHDPAAASELLAEAGFPATADGAGPRLKLSYKTSTDQTALLQAQVVQAMLAEIGVEIEIRSYEFATFYGDVKRGAFQLYSLMWTGVADPDIYRYCLHSASIPPAGANRNRYRNPRFDELIDRAARLFEPAERRPLYLEAQEIVHRDLPYVSLFTRHTVAVAAEGLEGYESYPSGELLSLTSARWNG